MTFKGIGGLLILLGCLWAAFALGSAWRQQSVYLRQLLQVVRMMAWELSDRLTPLPELCALAARNCTGNLRGVFLLLKRELDWQTEPDVAGCMAQALKKAGDLPREEKRLLRLLGNGMGRYELSAQIQGLKAVEMECLDALKKWEEGKRERLRSCQTLTICTGLAMVIVFL